MKLFRPKGYFYLTRWEWFVREIAMFGCQHKLWHIKYGGKWGCFCDFWDAQ